MVTGLLCALAIGAPAGDRLLLIDTLTCWDWASLANDYIAMGPERAASELIERSKRPQTSASRIDFNVRTSLMARLLFQPEGKEALRQPLLGGLPLPYRSMPLNEWPLYPFVKHNDVLFLLSESYLLAGKAEWTEMYIRYCQKNGTFRTKPYKVPTSEEAKKALQSLYASRLWKGLHWTYKSPHENYTISPSWVAEYLAKQTVPGDF